MMTAMNLVSGMARPRWAFLASLSLWLALAPASASAENILRNASYQTGSGGAVDVVLEFAEPVGGVQTFTTDHPPRIAIYIPDTRNRPSQRRVAVGRGAPRPIPPAERRSAP